MADRVRPHRISRSRSPQKEKPDSHSHRIRSPHRHRHHHKNRAPADSSTPAILPFNARPLTKHDYKVFKPLLAVYLDLQKGKILEELDEVEVKGRWKSFMGKWNRGEISEGYYDPSMLQRAQKSAGEYEPIERPKRGEGFRSTTPKTRAGDGGDGDEGSESDDSIGPALPGQEGRRGKMGPSVPSMQDLELKREMATEDDLARRDDVRYERKLDRRAQKDALNELVPRAEAGTRERQLEKKKEVNEKMKGFREKSPGVELPDQELMGGGDSVGEYKKMKDNFERKKTERELRKEENLRARMEERRERQEVYRKKEDETMAMLKELARQRFGGGT